MAHKEFLVPQSTVEPPSFTVLGQTFICLPEPPAGALTDLIGSAEGSTVAQATAAVSFLAAVLPDADAARFEALIHAKDTVVPIEVLSEILQWVTEQYTGRPTMPSSTLQAGPQPTPVMSEGGSDLPASPSPVAV